MYDEVNAPLGLDPTPAATPLSARLGELGRIVVGAAVFAAAIGLFANARREPPLNAGPWAAAKVEPATAPAAPASTGAPAATGAIGAADATPAVASADQLEAASGIKVVRPGGGGAPRGIVIDVARALAATLKPAPDERPVEKPRWSRSPR